MKKIKPFKVNEKSVYATGKRKTSIARVWINKGRGKVVVNGFEIENYFARNLNDADKAKVEANDYVCLIKNKAVEALSLTSYRDDFDVMCFVKGGGRTGQVEAIRHAIAKCIKIFDEDKKKVLRSEGLLTRDSRVVERKKCGKKKARKSKQFSKR